MAGLLLSLGSGSRCVSSGSVLGARGSTGPCLGARVVTTPRSAISTYQPRRDRRSSSVPASSWRPARISPAHVRTILASREIGRPRQRRRAEERGSAVERAVSRSREARGQGRPQGATQWRSAATFLTPRRDRLRARPPDPDPMKPASGWQRRCGWCGLVTVAGDLLDHRGVTVAGNLLDHRGATSSTAVGRPPRPPWGPPRSTTLAAGGTVDQSPCPPTRRGMTTITPFLIFCAHHDRGDA